MQTKDLSQWKVFLEKHLLTLGLLPPKGVTRMLSAIACVLRQDFREKPSIITNAVRSLAVQKKSRTVSRLHTTEHAYETIGFETSSRTMLSKHAFVLAKRMPAKRVLFACCPLFVVSNICGNFSALSHR